MTRLLTIARSPPQVDGVPIDTGFLVYNENTYPNLIGLFEELGVPTEPSNMSFAVSVANRTQEWSSNGLNALFATRSNLVSPAFYGMVADIVRFNKWVGRGCLVVTVVVSDPHSRRLRRR